MKVIFVVVLCVLINSTLASTNSSLLHDRAVEGKNINCTILDPPEKEAISIAQTAVNITWLISQRDSNCIPNQINVTCLAYPTDNYFGSKWVTNSTTEHAVDNGSDTIVVSVENLTEFTNYTCIGTLLTSEGLVAAADVTLQTEKEVAGPPVNLTINDITNHSYEISWSPPEKNPGVFQYYQLHIVSNTANHYLPGPCLVPSQIDKWSETLVNVTKFYDGAPDYIYEVTVFLVNDAGNGTNVTTNVTTLTAPSQAPRNFQIGTPLLDEERNTIRTNATWQMPCYTNGPISLFNINVKGYYMLNDSITDTRYLSVNAADTENYFREIDDLMPASNYTISISANGDNETGIFGDYFLITEDNLPGPPIIRNITNIESKSFTASWDEPQRKAGNITKYELTISGNPMYSVNLNRCSIRNETFNLTVEGDTQTYNLIDKISPYYRYNMSIRAFTSKGSGKASNVSVKTMSSEPEKPENVAFILKNDNSTGNISWMIPCNVNGPVEEFTIALRWFYSVDQSFTGNKTQSVSYRNGTETYYHSVPLIESHRYEATVWVVLSDGTAGSGVQTNITTPDGYPGAPSITNVTVLDENSFTVYWDPPTTKTGRITDYEVVIKSLVPLYQTKCSINNETFSYNMSSSSLTYNFTEGWPYYNYSIMITASTSKGFGSFSENVFTKTKAAVPETVDSIITLISNATQEEYNAYLDISFDAPCRLNGRFRYYQLVMLGVRTNYTDHRETVTYNSTSFSNVALKPEYNYTFYIETVNEVGSNKTGTSTFFSPPGVPLFSSAMENLSITTDIGTATLTIEKNYFDTRNGDIKYVALIVSDQNTTGDDFQSWNENEWPQLPSTTNAGEYYQITKDWWNPFLESNIVRIKIGENTTCTDTERHCNKPLQSSKDYYLNVRIFTSNFYKDSPAKHFRTEDISKLGTILGTIFGLLAIALVATAAFIVWQKKIIELSLVPPRKSSTKSATNINTAVPSCNFLQYYKSLENNPEKLSEQYALLAEKTKEAVRMQTSIYAALTENRRKNRYTNILPYDDTRVKLLIDEDDEIGSDYVNASYIRGYSGRVEYIATQGPLPSTCRDFWKMVVQEKVSIIAMVTQFIEQHKEKCYKYFPNNHESMSIGDDMEVKCTLELHFGSYCVRTLQVKKDNTQVTVTHMQYLDWPDFNVPSGTETMLQFCCQLRDRLEMEGGYVIVHCSAGVGRTGTLIATDILLQTINAGKHIDVFNTVLELRKQRTNMVQTQKQYLYIHNLIKDSVGMNDNAEAIYEPLKIKGDNLINKEKEGESHF